MMAAAAKVAHNSATILHASSLRARSYDSKYSWKYLWKIIMWISKKRVKNIVRHRNHLKLHFGRKYCEKTFTRVYDCFWEKKVWTEKSRQNRSAWVLIPVLYTCFWRSTARAVLVRWTNIEYLPRTAFRSLYSHFLRKFYFFLLFWNGSKETVDQAICKPASKQVFNTHLAAYLEALHDFSPKVSASV